MQGCSTRTNETELGITLVLLIVQQIFYEHIPTASSVWIKIEALDIVMHGHAFHLLKAFNHTTGESAKVHIRASIHFRCSYRLGLIASLHDERGPFRNLTLVLRISHVTEKRASLEQLVSLA